MENTPPNNKKSSYENLKTILFMVALSFVCALVLSLLASALRKPQEDARELYRSKQMLIAARIINPKGYFQVADEKGEYIAAKYAGEGRLAAASQKTIAADDQILAVYRERIEPFLVNQKGAETSFKQEGINEQEYVAEYRKGGYYNLPLKLIYKIYANPESNSGAKQGRTGEKKKKAVEGYVIPVNGFGLWDAIYGYLAIKPDGNSVIGISWYNQRETPGLGGNIGDAEWQSQFPGKKIFQPDASGKTDFSNTVIGITVVKGKVNEVLGDIPKAKNAVDGMAGATLTGNGVTNAYRNVLSAYRPFLIKLHKESENTSQTKPKSTES